MRYDVPLYLSAPSAVLGEREHTAADAVAGGLIDEENAARYAYTALRVSDLAPVQLAERAVLATLAGADFSARAVGRLLYAWTHHQGHEFWSPAHYVADRVGASGAEPVGIQQMCNGGLSAIGQAGRDLIADPDTGEVLVATGDCFPAPGFDRWGGDYGVCYGDGGTAVLVGRSPRGRSVRLLSLETVAAPVLEGMHRGDAPFTPGALSGVKTLLPRVSTKEFLVRNPELDFGPLARRAVVPVRERALRTAGVAADDPRLRVAGLPRLARHVMRDAYRPAFASACGAPIAELGLDTGHLGAGDAVANLAALLDGGLADPGDLVVLLSAGAGFTWSVAIVEVASL
jgi:3-oxoacyl-[acyl-carrier-protein] synthase-3